jgi:hypothetical protein
LINTALEGKKLCLLSILVNHIFDNVPEDLNLIEKWSSELINNIPMPEQL